MAEKRHHIRFFPPGGPPLGDKNGNSLPGTLVERDVTHPFEYDFYLCSHAAIQGTARPTHYHVLMDECGVTGDAFQQMLYECSYQYMRATTPVSLCKYRITWPVKYLANFESSCGLLCPYSFKSCQIASRHSIHRYDGAKEIRRLIFRSTRNRNQETYSDGQ